ncbi:hypothetical protein DEH69_17585, partial [Streptomyces sp. PT12]
GQSFTHHHVLEPVIFWPFLYWPPTRPHPSHISRPTRWRRRLRRRMSAASGVHRVEVTAASVLTGDVLTIGECHFKVLTRT